MPYRPSCQPSVSEKKLIPKPYPGVDVSQLPNVSVMWSWDNRENPHMLGHPVGWRVSKWRFRATKIIGLTDSGVPHTKIWDRQYPHDLWKALAYKWYYKVILNPNKETIHPLDDSDVDRRTVRSRLDTIEKQNREILALLKGLKHSE